MDNSERKSHLDGLSDVEILDKIIRYSKRSHYGEKDSELAARLIANYGTLRDVLKTDVRSLLCVKGLDERTAVFISLFYQAAQRIGEEKIEKIHKITDTQTAKDYFRALLKVKRNECFAVVALNDKRKVLDWRIISEGYVNQSVVDIRGLMLFLIDHNATGAIIAHNHPSASPEPSYEDIMITRKLIQLLRTIDIELIDHIIVGKNSDYSIMTESENPLLNI